ncbi:hypothetical protein, partial [Pectobacterium aquaticum]|uniref:hypothetical protein n=1 Tax=Pectobacterium aquaticum TaxID=2204145 RepID=UPI001D012C20
ITHADALGHYLVENRPSSRLRQPLWHKRTFFFYTTSRGGELVRCTLGWKTRMGLVVMRLASQNDNKIVRKRVA